MKANNLVLCFVTNSGNVIRLGTWVRPVLKADLREYVRRFPIHWFEFV